MFQPGVFQPGVFHVVEITPPAVGAGGGFAPQPVRGRIVQTAPAFRQRLRVHVVDDELVLERAYGG